MNKFAKLAAILAVPLVLAGAGLYTNGLPGVTAGGSFAHMPTRALVPVDTQLPNGQSPQTVGAEAFRIAATISTAANNTATSTAAAATVSKLGGTITTEALTTAAGATYTFTLTNTLITTSSKPMVDIYSLGNTAAAANMVVTSVTPATGSAVFVFTNNGTAALNGTMLIVFHL